MKKTLIVMMAWFFVSVSGFASSEFDKVQQLGLTHGNLLLGAKFVDSGDFVPEREAWPGTRRYRRNSLVVAVEARTQRIIALFEEYPALSPEDLKKLVGTLVARFGEPTFEAHDRMLFWYFTSKGKVSSEEFERLRESGKVPELLAVAKFYCNQNIIDFADKKRRDDKAKAYFTVYSPALIKRFVRIETIHKQKIN